jgi:hypothetical protein
MAAVGSGRRRGTFGECHAGMGKVREREKSSSRASSPPYEASRALVRRRGAIERRRGELPRSAMAAAERARVARV